MFLQYTRFWTTFGEQAFAVAHLCGNLFLLISKFASRSVFLIVNLKLVYSSKLLMCILFCSVPNNKKLWFTNVVFERSKMLALNERLPYHLKPQQDSTFPNWCKSLTNLKLNNFITLKISHITENFFCFFSSTSSSSLIICSLVSLFCFIQLLWNENYVEELSLYMYNIHLD